MRPRKVSLLLAVVGFVCLPAPLYLGWAAGAAAPPPKTSQIYFADPVDPANESDQAAIVDRHATLVALSVHQVSERYSAGEYRAPAETRRTLETAMREGRATTDDPDARADLRTIARNHTFVHDAYGDDERFYELRVTDRGATVRASNVSRDRVARAVVDRAPRYDDLTAGERRTVDRIVANSTADGDGYRPHVDDPFVDRLPTLVVTDGGAYSIVVYGHVDDFGPGFGGFVAGLAVAGVGVVLLLAAALVRAVAWWRERTEDPRRQADASRADTQDSTGLRRR